MNGCLVQYCENKIEYVCNCQDSLERFCEEHIKEHIQEPTCHQVIKLAQDHVQIGFSHLKIILEKSLITLTGIEQHIESYLESLLASVKDTERTLNKIRNIKLYTEQYIRHLEGDNQDLNDIAKMNLDLLKFAPQSNIEKSFKISSQNIDNVVVPKIELSGYSDYFKIIKKISRPILKYEKFALQYDPAVYILPGMPVLKFYHSLYRSVEVTVTVIDCNHLVERQLQYQSKYMKIEGDKFLKIFETYKQKSKIIVITEKWTHTILNEIYSRTLENIYFDYSFVFEILLCLLRTFKNENRLLLFTPNVIHVTGPGTFKLWYPYELSSNTSKTAMTYLSPEVYINNEEISPQSHNIFSIGLVVLQIATLKDTSMVHLSENNSNGKEWVMHIPDSPLRRTLIGMLIISKKSRLTFEKALHTLTAN